jgi:hypothetical protein
MGDGRTFPNRFNAWTLCAIISVLSCCLAGTRFKHLLFFETTAASFQLNDRIRTATPGGIALIEHLVRRLQFHALNFEKLHRL